MFILLLPVALANTNIEVEPIKNQITSLEEAKFDVTIKNLGPNTQNYKIYAIERGWIIDPLPFDRTFELKKGEVKNTIVTVKPVEQFKPGAYVPTLYVDGFNGNSYETLSESLTIYLSPDQPVQYLPSIVAKIDMNEKIDPRDPVLVKLFLENRNPLNLSGLKIRLQSDIPEFSKEVNVDLPPLEKKAVEFTIIPNKIQQPKDYILFFVLEKNGQAVKVIEQKIEVLTITPEFNVLKTYNKEFLKTTSNLEIKNNGNVVNEQVVKEPISFWKSILTSSYGKVVKENGERFLVWEVSLSPDKTTIISYTTNYRYILYFLLVVLLFILFYWYAKSPVVINKLAYTKSLGEDGTMSNIKVTLEVKNVTGKPVRNIEVVDLVPGIADIEKGLEIGTLKPQEIKRTKKGTKVVWKLVELDSLEQRLITYSIKTKLKVVGTFNFPRAQLEYVVKKGKKRKAYSNKFSLGVQ